MLCTVYAPTKISQNGLLKGLSASSNAAVFFNKYIVLEYNKKVLIGVDITYW